MDKKKVKDYLAKAQNALLRYDKAGDKSAFTRAFNLIQDASLELYKSDWVSVEEGLPPVDKEVIVLTTGMAIYFGHIVDKRIAKDYNGWNIPNVEYWLPFVDPKDEQLWNV